MPRILAAATVLLLPRLLRRTLLTWGPLALSRAAQASDLVTLPEVARCNGLQLRPQRLIGGGAQGSVFLTQAPVSRPSTGASVSRECAILQRLQDVPNIVRCVEDCVVEGRRSSLLWPYFADATQLSSQSTTSVVSLLQTAVQLLKKGVAVADVQVLQKSNGELLWIDFTEAKLLEEEDFEVAARNFVAEVFALVPTTSRPAAIRTLVSCCAEGGAGRYGYLWAELPWSEEDMPELGPC
ncbi:unnamed protein product [Durusdinium trenchii]|uniref:Protein kinase domain-containing protein n=1 Tax=Durusdinium trenchii TaxID=1381693 RepID=A0ABP0R0I2_9DINO